MRKILVLNGPNINMLGIREKNIYGRDDYDSLCVYIRSAADRLGVEVELLQSNYEGDIVTAIQNAYGHFDGIYALQRSDSGRIEGSKYSCD